MGSLLHRKRQTWHHLSRPRATDGTHERFEPFTVPFPDEVAAPARSLGLVARRQNTQELKPNGGAATELSTAFIANAENAGSYPREREWRRIRRATGLHGLVLEARTRTDTSQCTGEAFR